MSISVKLSGKLLELKILDGPPGWEADLASIKGLPDRKFNPSTKLWEVPWYAAIDVLSHIPAAIASSDVRGIVERSGRTYPKMLQLAPIIKPLEFARFPKVYQERYIRMSPLLRRTLMSFEQGTGKCLEKGTTVLMFDGSTRKVEDIAVGDLLMGPDSKSRRVISLARGREKMYRVIPTKGEPFGCNESHILSLKYSGARRVSRQTGDVINISVKEYLQQHKSFRDHTLLWRTGVEFPSSPVNIDPWLLGCWLGDGTSTQAEITSADHEVVSQLAVCAADLGVTVKRRSQSGKSYSYGLNNGIGSRNPLKAELKKYCLLENKHIPSEYKFNDMKTRLELIAGLLDSDGYLYSSTGFDWINKNKTLAEDFVWLCRSVGLAAYLNECQKSCVYKGQVKTGTYYRVSISGDCSIVPCKVERKKAHPRRQIKSVLVTGFTLEDRGEGDYYGFELEGPDRLFLLGDFTVTHNTYVALERARVLGYKRLLIVCPKVVCANWRTEVRTIYDQPAIIYLGTKTKRAKLAAELVQSDLPVICTYETMSEIALLLSQGKVEFDHVIFDEAHLLSNPESKRFKQAEQLCDQVPDCAMQCLTGTPMQHRVRDLWGILHLLDPLFAGSYCVFRDRYEEPIRWMDRKVKTGLGWRVMRVAIKWRTRNLDELRERLECISFRVRREDVTSFRDAMETVTVDLTSSQRKLYENMKRSILVEIDNKEINLRHVPVRLLRLLQAAEGTFNFDAKNLDSGKLDYLRDLLDNTQEKVIVWSRFKPITEILGKLYKDRCVVYNGDRSDNYKQLAKWAFNGVDNEEDAREYQRLKSRQKELFPFQPGEAQFFFGTIDMRSSLGMNLHADCCRQVFTSFSWMGAANAQAADRLRRIGQKSEVVKTEFLVSEDTFESRALSMVMSNFSDTVKALDGTERMSFRQMQDIIQLLRDSA